MKEYKSRNHTEKLNDVSIVSSKIGFPIEQASKITFVNKVLTIKFIIIKQKSVCDIHAVFLITSRKKRSSKYAPF